MPQRSRACWLAVACLLLSCRSALADGVRVVYDVKDAETLARKTGKPLLAIAGSADCVYCRKMAGQLENDKFLEPVASQFIILKIDTATEVWQQWKSRYPYEGSDGVPIVFAVRGDGKQIYGRVGAPQQLEAFLRKLLTEAATILSPEELAELEKAGRAAQRAFKRKDFAAAIEIVNKHSESGSVAAAALGIDLLARELVEKARLGVKDSEKKLASTDKVLDGAIALLELKEEFGALKSAQQLIEPALTKHRDDPAIPDLFAQAELVQKARRLESSRTWPEALAAWQDAATKFPDSPAAALAAKKIPDLEKRVAVSTGSAKTRPAGAGVKPAAADTKKAESYLTLGKQFRKNNPPKAREYFQKALDAAPNTEVAKEAERLLKELPAE